jgi:PhzF family phenazine biosynthesis protein
MKFYIVDAFTDTLFGGNPAGVVILERGADFPEEAVMQKTAAELRYSETAFIRQTGEKEFHLRYFTPAAEVELCGHATIGTFSALIAAGLVARDTVCIADTMAGRLNIVISEGSVLMDMAVPKVMGKITQPEAISELYAVMGISEANQGEVLSGNKTGIAMIPEMISTGLPDIILPVRNEAELAAIHPDFAALTELSKRYEVVGVHAFTLNTEDGAIHCRNFAPLYDIDEEAATGTSNGALTYYLYQYGLVLPGIDNRIIQGEAMDRPSKIASRLSANGGEIKIQVGGSAVILASGEINL